MGEHNIYRDGRVHVMSDLCGSCIFKPHERPVDGARVAEMVRATMDEDGATVVCHKTLYREVDEHAICRGWLDRFGRRDRFLELADRIGIMEEVPPPVD